MYPDPDSAIFGIDPQDANKTLLFLNFFCLLLFEGIFTSSQKIKGQKDVTKQ